MTTEYLAYHHQRTAHEQLGELLALGQRRGLPPLAWTIADNGVLTGEVHAWGRSRDGQRAAITIWARYLKTTVQETVHFDGVTRLYAPWDGDNGERAGCIRTELPPARD